MPGIVGLQTRMPRSWAEPRLQRMVQSLQHEDFYVCETWVDESVGLYLGWVERKEAMSDEMPLRNERGDIVLAFSGEEFSDVRSECGQVGQGRGTFPGSQSYLMQQYEEYPEFPAGLNGRFHGVVVDRRNGTAVLFNDRYGLHRLYYHMSEEAFYFAAEAKAILAVRPDLRRMDPRSLGEFITCGCVLENRTLFEGIHVLPCASKWVFRDGIVEEKGSYFDPREWEDQDILDPEAFYRDLRDVFVKRLPRYFEAKERISISLTGGLDTRMILAWHELPPGTMPCYTFSGMFRDCRDAIVGKQVAKVCKQAHEVIRVGKEFLARFPRYAERTVYLTDGCADLRRATDLYVNECAREIAPIRMTGNYGSEVLRRVVAFKPVMPMPGLFSEGLRPYLHKAEETYKSLLKGHPLSFAVFKQAPWHHFGLLALEQTQVTLRSPYLDNDLIRTVFRAPESAVTSHEVCLRLVAEGNPVLRAIPTDRGLGGTGLAGSASRKLLEFLTKAEYAYDYGMPQWLAGVDHILSPFHFERLFLGRQKFNHYRIWYRDMLSDYVREMLLDSKSLSRAYLERGRIEGMVQGHIKGDRNYTNEIHTVMTLELVHRLFIDQ